jgi:hypothetical protein
MSQHKVTSMLMMKSGLLIVAISLLGYTLVVVDHHGIDLLSVFFGDIMEMTWQGQFNLDFMCMLVFSGLWVSWRHHFGAVGIALGLCAFFGGALFLSLYLFQQLRESQGDLQTLIDRRNP